MDPQEKDKMVDPEQQKAESVNLLFDISKQVKQFYEVPVCFLTKKDYSDIAFNVLCTIRAILNSDRDENRMIGTIVDYHLQWLQSVKEIEKFRDSLEELPRQEIHQAVSYTIDCMASRLKYYQKYMETYRKITPREKQADLNTELELVDDMHTDTMNILCERLKCFKNFCGDYEFIMLIKDEVEKLLNWLDKISDNLVYLLNEYVNAHAPQLVQDMTNTLQQIVNEMQFPDAPPLARKVLDELEQRGEDISTMVKASAGHTLEISKVVEKIDILNDRINSLKKENSTAAVMALECKKEYLAKRLISIENLKISLLDQEGATGEKEPKEAEACVCLCGDFLRKRIFNHALPQPLRESLVTSLCCLWDVAIFGKHKSLISILSASQLREEFTDEIGTFYMDEHGRKIYRIPDSDVLYQCNDQNVLVPLSDETDRIYYYDSCGRYFLDPETGVRVYKAHAKASEYMMDSSGLLIKLKEVRDGTTYYYDCYGRYYINKEGKNIYREPDALSEYENDGLGNLVRIKDTLDIFRPCPHDENVTEDFKYLKKNVGAALRECIADTMLRQPSDPIKYLATRLVKYRDNIEQREKRAREQEELMVEREHKAAEERGILERAAMEAALLTHGGSEASYDSNLYKYSSVTVGPHAPTSVSSK